MESRRKPFGCNDSGYIRHWAISNIEVTPYIGGMTSENQLRKDIIDPEIVYALSEVDITSDDWRYYDPGQNIFVEQSGFYHQLSMLDMYGVTYVETPDDMELPTQFWACGTADLWINGIHICRHNVPKYMYPESVQVNLPLKRGRNRLSVRLQALGVRDTRFLFGLQAMDSADKLVVWLPGSDDLTYKLAEIEEWLESVRVSGCDTLRSAIAAPIEGSVQLRGRKINWPEGENHITFDPTGQSNISLETSFGGQGLRRSFEIPTNRKIALSGINSIEEHRREIMQYIADTGRGIRAVLARHALGERSDADEVVIFDTLDRIDSRPDCADFDLAAMVRLYIGDSLTEGERERIKRTALAFRYWSDDPGNDAMCFESENHSLLFHGCQLIAGQLFPDEIFSNTGKTGAEQAEIGQKRCLKWLEQVEKRGFQEFLSSTYMPLTAAALLNLVDFSGDADISTRAAALVDEIFNILAMHSFDGLTVGPQGRVYRGVLYPESSGTQAMLSYVTPKAIAAHSDWLAFVGASPSYHPPEGIEGLMRKPTSEVYRQASVEIQLEKTADYLLTSLQIPASFQEEPPANAGRVVYPGRAGYQQHLWQATLGRDCHIFVNHPGASFDMSSSRPGFWYGNGIIPRTVQRNNMLLQIFDIPESHPIHFTHAHWPGDTFDSSEIQEHWAFGVKGTGYIALWCSQPLKLHSEVLTDRELRAQGLKAGWIAVCMGRKEAGNFNSFVQNCINMRPEFDPVNLVLHLAGKEGLAYVRSPELRY